ncbi:MAG: glutaredoxin family protein, partial [Erysipelotrichaceae bacterium]|nr:glutaredoxin family protein [Erysipelotrichaceae bacterium]
FADRKTYSIAGIGKSLKDVKAEVHHEEVKEEPKVEVVQEEGNKILLFTTKTCPNCKIVKEMLNKRGVQYETVDAEENAELCDRYSIMQAPTMVKIEDGQAEVYANASNIIRYLNRIS